ncbi:MAG: M56 family metallopeptidase [Pseudomonadota bacterium]
MILWLLSTSLEMCMAIVLVLLLRVPAKRWLGANAGYWLWAIVPLQVVPNFVERPVAVSDSVVPVDLAEMGTLLGTVSVPWFEIWLFGLLIMVGTMIINSVFLFRRLEPASHVLFEGTPSGVRTCLSRHRAAPFTLGLAPPVWRPTVYLPLNFQQRFNDDEQRWILQHEYRHIARHDLPVRVVAEILRAVFWFNPLLHLAIPLFRHDQECACDQDLVGERSDQDRLIYGQTLLKGTLSSPSLVTFFNNRKERFKMLKQHTRSPFRSLIGLTLCVLLVVGSGTTAPRALGDRIMEGTRLSLNFQDIDIQTVVKMILDLEDLDSKNLDILGDRKISMLFRNVTSTSALGAILKCAGYDYHLDTEGEVTFVIATAKGAKQCSEATLTEQAE